MQMCQVFRCDRTRNPFKYNKMYWIEYGRCGKFKGVFY